MAARRRLTGSGSPAGSVTALVGLALGVGACFAPTPRDGLPCGPEKSCPLDLVCRLDGTCGASELDADPPGIDAAVIDATAVDATVVDAAFPRRCAGRVDLFDDFDQPGAGAGIAIESAVGLTISEHDSLLDVEFAAQVDDNHYGGYATTAETPTADLCVVVRVNQLPNFPAIAYLKLRSVFGLVGSITEAEFLAFNNELYLRTLVGADATNHDIVPVDLAEHGYWRLRMSGGDVIWETSSDGVDFFELKRATVTLPSKVQARVGAGTQMQAMGAGNALFDELTVGTE
ncbi:MAG: hypothetical protein R2939_01380 [Kofleriaceae bacterium]